MRQDEIAGYACPVCNTANPLANKYCSHCGTWLFDTKREAKPLSKKEFKKHSKKEQNPYKRMAFSQAMAICFMIIALLMKSQMGFDLMLLAYLFGLMISNLRATKKFNELQLQAQAEEQSKLSDTKTNQEG